MEVEDGNSYFRAVVSDAIKEVLKGGIAYCFQQEQLDTIKDILLNKHKVKDENIYFNIVDGIYCIVIKEEAKVNGN